MKTAVLGLILSWSLCGQSYTVSTVAGGGLPVNVTATSASIGYVSAVAVDPAGNLFFASGNAVIKMDAVTKITALVAGTGTPGFSGDNGPATSAQLNAPIAIAVDSAGSLYLTNTVSTTEVSAGLPSVPGNRLCGRLASARLRPGGESLRAGEAGRHSGAVGYGVRPDQSPHLFRPDVNAAPAATTPTTLTIGVMQVPVIGTVLTAGSVGLYQITVQLPANMPAGAAVVQASVGGPQTPAGVVIYVGQ